MMGFIFIYLSIFQWVQFREVGGTTDFIVSQVIIGRFPGCGRYVVQLHTVIVIDSEILPGLIVYAIQRFLQDPVSGTRGVGGFHDNVRYLVYL